MPFFAKREWVRSDGSQVRVGDVVPEAAGWVDPQVWIDQGWVEKREAAATPLAPSIPTPVATPRPPSPPTPQPVATPVARIAPKQTGKATHKRK
jgi:hypothetical protein